MKMKTLLILGAGQYGLAARDIASATGQFSKIDFLDDVSTLAVGKLSDIEHIDYDEAFVAIGNPVLRKAWFSKIKCHATLIHPAAVVMQTAEIGEGAIIEPFAVVSTNAKIGSGTIIMSGAVVGHDASVGDFCQLKYNSVVPERATVPDGTKLDCAKCFEV